MEFNEDNIELFEQIEAYLSGELTGTARAAFEQQIAADPQLAEEVVIQRAMNLGLANLDFQAPPQEDREKLKAMIAHIHQEAIVKDTGSGSKGLKTGAWPHRRWIWTGAAAAVILLIVLIRFFYPDDASMDAKLVAQYQVLPFEEYKGNTASDSVLASLQRLYEVGAYEKGLEQLNELARMATTDSTLIWHLTGFFYAAQGDSAAALQAFRRVADDDASIYDDRARLQVALTYLQFHDRPHARQTLEMILSDTSIRPGLRADAQAILDAIR